MQGSTFADWLSRLDRPSAQAAWRLLADIKRQATAGSLEAGRPARRRLPAAVGQRDRTTDRPLTIEGARFRHRTPVQPIQPVLPDPPSPPTDPSPRGGDDAA